MDWVLSIKSVTDFQHVTLFLFASIYIVPVFAAVLMQVVDSIYNKDGSRVHTFVWSLETVLAQGFLTAKLSWHLDWQDC